MSVQMNEVNEASPLLNLSTDEESHLLTNGDSKDHVKTERSLLKASLNIAKMCMGTGTLALPYGASQGGLIFNVIGICFIAIWNLYSMDRLICCLDYIPSLNDGSSLNNSSTNCKKHHRKTSSFRRRLFKRTDSNRITIDDEMVQDIIPENKPPHNTATFGKVAWYVFGTPGLWFFDTMMLTLMLGVIIAYQDAVIGFLEDTPLRTSTKWSNAAIVSLIFIPFCWVSNLESLAKFSALGILTIMGIFLIIGGYGIQEYGMNLSTNDLYLWPQNMTGLSNWFGIVVFGYGFVPFTYNIHESMKEPSKDQIKTATQYALFLIVSLYSLLSVSIPIIFAPSQTKLDGDVLQLLPHGNDTAGVWIATFVRLAMILVIAVTGPLIVVPTGELIQGKLGLPDKKNRFIVTAVIIVVSGILAANLPNFVYIVSFLGCLTVSILSFICPPLFHLILLYRHKKKLPEPTTAAAAIGDDINHAFDSQGNSNGKAIETFLFDTILLIWGILASVITSILTGKSLMDEMNNQ